MSATIRIHSWNVNGIRSAAKKGFDDFLFTRAGDIVALQETRAHEAQVPEALAAGASGIAAISAILAADDTAEATRTIRAELDTA